MQPQASPRPGRDSHPARWKRSWSWVRVLIGRPAPVIILSLLMCAVCPIGVLVLYVMGDRTLAEVAAAATATAQAVIAP